VASVPLQVDVNVVQADLLRLRLRPGDRLLLKVHGRLSPEQTCLLREQAEQLLAPYQVLVIDEGMDLSVLPAAGPEPDHVAVPR